MRNPERPIGIFDSGVGGLTVVDQVVKRLPGESIIYFGDTARVPYGPKSPETVQRYSREAAAFLLSQHVKAIVVACNTATAHAAAMLRETLPVPVIGVIEPGATAAVNATRSKRVGVIGTAGTIASGAYDLAVRARLPDARIYAQPCPLFVPIVEEGWAKHEAARLIATEYLTPIREQDIDVLVLGCTHYPLLRNLIGDIMGPGVKLVDSAEQTAIELQRVLVQNDLCSRSRAGVHRFAASDSPLRFRHVARHFLGEVVQDVELIDVDGFDRAA